MPGTYIIEFIQRDKASLQVVIIE